MAEIEEEPVSFSDLIKSVENVQNIFSEMSKLLSDDETTDRSGDAPLIVQWGREIKELEDNEKKLIDEFNQVMSNLYLFPGYILAVSTGVSGLLSCDPHFCWLLGNVIVVVVIFLAALWLAIRFANRQLIGLQAKAQELVAERTKLQRSYLTHIKSIDERIRTTNPVLKKLKNYESKNSELAFQAQHYYTYLLLITICGVLYAFMLLVAGYFVLCGSQSNAFFPCTPCTPPTPPTPPCLHSAIPLEPVPDHLSFPPGVPSVRPYQDM